MTSSDRRRTIVICLLSECLDQRRTFFQSLFQDIEVTGASAAPAAQNSRVPHVFVWVWGRLETAAWRSGLSTIRENQPEAFKVE
jgi:hypothetical protein